MRTARESWKKPPNVPLLSKTPTASTSNTAGASTVLSVAKIGDWTADNMGYEFPIQMFDAARDLIQNLIIHVVRKQKPNFGLQIMQGIFNLYTDANLKDAFAKGKITPAAWASRSTRNLAISKAKKAVYVDIEIIASFLHLRNPRNKNEKSETKDKVEAGIASINKEMKLAGDQAWDGVLWPYGKPTHLNKPSPH